MAELLAARAISGAVGGLLLLCIKLYDKRKKVQRFEKDCDKLLEFVRRIQVILETTAAHADLKQPGWHEAFEALDSALRGVHVVFDHCSKYGLIKSIMNADDMNMRLSNIAQQLQSALMMIPIQQGNDTADKLAELRQLQVDLQRAQWAATRAAEQQAAELKRLSDQSAVDANKTHEMLQQILVLLTADAGGGRSDTTTTSSSSRSSSSNSRSGGTSGLAAASAAAAGGSGVFGCVQHEQLEAEKQELQEWLQEFKLDKRDHEEHYVQQIIQMIEWLEAAEASGPGQPATAATAAATAATAAAAAAAAPGNAQLKMSGPPSTLKCPITLQLFRDPVLLVGSGHTYEKAAIEEWLSRGNLKDPLTGKSLPCTTLVPNINVRQVAQDWVADNPWFNTEVQQQQQQQAGEGHEQQLRQHSAAAGAVPSPQVLQQLSRLSLNMTHQQQQQQHLPAALGQMPPLMLPYPLVQHHQQQQQVYYPPIQPVSAPVIHYSDSEGDLQSQAGFSTYGSQAGFSTYGSQGSAAAAGLGLDPTQQLNPAAHHAYCAGSAASILLNTPAAAAAGSGSMTEAWSVRVPSAPPAPFPAAAAAAAAPPAGGYSAALPPVAGGFKAAGGPARPSSGLQSGPDGAAHSVFEAAAAAGRGGGASGLEEAAAAVPPAAPAPYTFVLLDRYSME